MGAKLRTADACVNTKKEATGTGDDVLAARSQHVVCFRVLLRHYEVVAGSIKRLATDQEGSNDVFPRCVETDSNSAGNFD